MVWILWVAAVAVAMVHGQQMAEVPQGPVGDSNSTVVATPQSTYTLKDAYLYGTLSVAIVSILSLAGVCVLPFIKRKIVYDSLMLLFMALSVGTMASDALLHLIPETMGLHGHSGDAKGHQHNHTDIDGDEHGEEPQGDKPYLGKMVALLATLYALYLLEVFAHIAAKVVKTVTVQDSSVAPAGGAMVDKVVAEGYMVQVVEMRDVSHGHSHQQPSAGHGHSHGGGNIGGTHTICGMKPVAFVVVISDAMHNFADGLAIGAGFAKSLSAGVAVSIAVVCHELPHEVGDFAILLNSGMSIKKALILNFVSALTCFAGLYPGIVAGQQEGLRQWIFAAVAGGFLYVALVHMLREIREYGSLRWYVSVILQNVGLLLGFVIILLLAIYEDRLQIED